MLGRPTLPSMYKRMTSKDYSSVVDTDLEDSALLDDTEPETSNLSWKPSLIHVLVATISSFLFGYHLGFVLTFAMGAGPVPGLLLPEIFPSRIRAKAMAVCMSVHWVVNFFVGLLFLQLLEQLGPQILFSIFAAFCLVAVIFVKRNVVETKGKSLQEIEITLLPQE